MNQMLRTGDILLFKAAKGNFVDQCITRLTGSEVCHAAMVYSDDSMIEMNAKGVGVYSMEEREGDSVYIMRMLSEPDPALLTKSANAYLAAEAIFNFPSLVILAGLLVYRNKVVRNDLFDISRKIILAACSELEHWLLQAAHGTTPALVCSQLVYQIYYNCGPDYKIKIKDGILTSTEEEDSLKKTFVTIDSSENSPADSPAAPQDLAGELLKILDSPCEEPAEPLLQTPIHNLTFHKKLIEILEKAEIKIDPESLFIMPGDFLSHSLNLKEVGKCNIVFKD